MITTFFLISLLGIDDMGLRGGFMVSILSWAISRPVGLWNFRRKPKTVHPKVQGGVEGLRSPCSRRYMLVAECPNHN